MSSNTDNNPDLPEVDPDTNPDVPELGEDVEARDDSQVMLDQIDLLESQLQEKEDLVFALTERLEQAAEQLDRYRRNGAKQGRTSGGGMPTELVQEQKTLFDEMRQMITQWEASQPGATLGRIELQVTELRDLVAGNVIGGELRSAVSSIIETPEPAVTKPAANTQCEQEFKPGSWEAQKAALMSGEPLPVAETPPAAEPPPTAEESAAEEPETEEDSDTPTPINLQEADIEQLRQGVLERDRIIASLKERLQQGGESGEVVKYDSMDAMPDEFREKLETLEEEWKDKIRETEVELSLERAKIAREKAELQQQQHKMQKQREKMGVGNSEGHRGGSSSGDEAGSGRWLRFLKRGGDDES